MVVLSESEIQYVLQRSYHYRGIANAEKVFNIDMLNLSEDNRFFQSYFYANEKYYINLSEFISSLNNKIKYRKKNNLLFKFTNNKSIEKIVAVILDNIGYQRNNVDLLKICKRYDINVEFQSNGYNKNVLGQIWFNPLKILIFDDDNNRARFTLAHELGHFFLKHNRFLESEFVTKKDFKENKNTQIDDILSIEREANYFASTILLPEKNIKHAFFCSLKRNNIRNPVKLYLDNQPDNITAASLVLQELSQQFSVSKQAVSIRLQRLYLLEDTRYLNPLKLVPFK